MPRMPLATELNPLLKRILTDVNAVKNDVDGMHHIILLRAVEDLASAVDLCQARIVPPRTSTARTTAVDVASTAAASTPDLAAAATPARRRRAPKKAGE